MKYVLTIPFRCPNCGQQHVTHVEQEKIDNNPNGTKTAWYPSKIQFTCPECYHTYWITNQTRSKTFNAD